MSEIMNLESFDTRLEDEHRVEQRVYETNIDGNKERVVETNVEKTLFGIPVSFQEKVTEKTVPIVASRKREVYKDGKLMETVVEELDGSLIKLHPVTPIVPSAPVVNPMATAATAAPAASNVLTKEDLVQAMREVLEAVLKKSEPVLELPEDVVPVTPPAPKPEPTPVPVQQDSWESLAWIVLSGELAFCVYNLVLKNWF